jgi:hypothetical protein
MASALVGRVTSRRDAELMSGRHDAGAAAMPRLLRCRAAKMPGR